jgi:hypothetical protein
MQIVQLKNEKSISEIIARLYGLKPDDPRSAEAAKALAASNPHLNDDVSRLPAGTPIIVPAIPGLSASVSDNIDPGRAAAVGQMDAFIGEVEKVTKATQIKDEKWTQALTVLRKSVENFKKVHS